MPTTPKAATTTRKRAPRKPKAADAIGAATTGAQLARALTVDGKTLRAYLRRKGIRLSEGDKLTPEAKADAREHFAAKGKATK